MAYIIYNNMLCIIPGLRKKMTVKKVIGKVVLV